MSLASACFTCSNPIDRAGQWVEELNEGGRVGLYFENPRLASDTFVSLIYNLLALFIHVWVAHASCEMSWWAPKTQRTLHATRSRCN